METKVTSHPFDWPGEEQKVRVRPSLRSPKFVTRVCRADLQVGTSLKTKRAGLKRGATRAGNPNPRRS